MFQVRAKQLSKKCKSIQSHTAVKEGENPEDDEEDDKDVNRT